MKILYIITGLACGGAEKQLLDVCSILSSVHNSNVKVISIAKNKEILELFVSNNIDVEIIPCNSFKNICSIINSIRKFEPDIVHSHMIHSNILLGLIYPFINNARVKYYSTAHNVVQGGKLKSFLQDVIYRVYSFNFSHVSANYIDGIKNKKIHDKLSLYINPTDITEFKNVRRSIGKERVWLCVASLTEQKRHDRLIDAFALHLERFPRDKLTLVGTGNRMEDLKTRCELLNIEESIIFLGKRNDIPELCKNSYAFILASDWEGLPVSLVEAAASGLPLIASNVGDVSTVLHDRVNGYLINTLEVTEFTNAISRLASISEEDYLGLSSASVKLAEKFDAKSIVDNLYSDYCL